MPDRLHEYHVSFKQEHKIVAWPASLSAPNAPSFDEIERIGREEFRASGGAKPKLLIFATPDEILLFECKYENLFTPSIPRWKSHGDGDEKKDAVLHLEGEPTVGS